MRLSSFVPWVAMNAALVTCAFAQDTTFAQATKYYEQGEFSKAVEVLKAAAAKDPNNGDIQILLAKSYLELNQIDPAVSAGEKAVSINPKNSDYHRWLGEAYGAKADRASMFSAYPLARKTQKEFDAGFQLDEKNFDVAQDLVEYDCTAPGVVGGGEDKAQPIIQKLNALDPAEGHYAAGNCKAVKKDYAAADAEFTKALDAKLKSLDRVYAIADYYAQRGQGDKVLTATDEAQALAPQDLRVNYFRAVAWIVKKEKLPDAQKLLKQYLQDAPKRPGDPKPYHAHYWLGRGYEADKNVSAARSEYEAALKLDGKYKPAQEGLKRLSSSGQ
jgi:tetratricopeptide (TPR) repeat protein